jgi:hypothetical protein
MKAHPVFLLEFMLFVGGVLATFASQARTVRPSLQP